MLVCLGLGWVWLLVMNLGLAWFGCFLDWCLSCGFDAAEVSFAVFGIVGILRCGSFVLIWGFDCFCLFVCFVLVFVCVDLGVGHCGTLVGSG